MTESRIDATGEGSPSRRSVLAAAAVAIPAVAMTVSTPAIAATGSVLTLQTSPVSGVPVGGTISVSGKYTGATSRQRLTLSSSDANVKLAQTTFSLPTSGTFSTTASVARVKTNGTVTMTATSNGQTALASSSYVYVPVASIAFTLSRSFSGDEQKYYINVSGTLRDANGNLVLYRTVLITPSENGTWRDALGGNTPDTDDDGGFNGQMYLQPGGARTITFTVSCENVSKSASISIAGS